MRFEELLIIMLIAGAVLILPVAAIVMSIIAFVKTRKLKVVTGRSDRIESYLRDVANGRVTVPQRVSWPVNMSNLLRCDVDYSRYCCEPYAFVRHDCDVKACPSPSESSNSTSVARSPSKRNRLRRFWLPWQKLAFAAAGKPSLGRKRSVGLRPFCFCSLRPFFCVMRIRITGLARLGVSPSENYSVRLVISGCRYLMKGWRRFSSMLMSTGIVVIYLATYSAFGFYQLLPQQHAGMFLAILVMESMLAAIFSLLITDWDDCGRGGRRPALPTQSDYDSYLFLFVLINAEHRCCCRNQRPTLASRRVRRFFGDTVNLLRLVSGGVIIPKICSWALGFQLSLFGSF